MSKQGNVPEALAALVIRAASVELRFSSDAESDKALGLYTTMVEGLRRPKLGQPPVSMRLGEEQELRFVKEAKNTSCTVIYWALADDTSDGLKNACIELEKQGCVVVEQPHPRPDQPETACSLLKDPASNLFGVIINPPYPFVPQ